jgi:glutamate dehydrogenase/leucine dehydrogenase
VPIQTLDGTDAFIVTDLPDAPATGIVRVARKVLTSSATDLARSATYSFAVFGIQRGGASAGINAEGDAVPAARDAFLAAVHPLVADGLHLDAGKGFDPAALSALADVDDRNPLHGSPAVAAAGVVAALEAALGPVEGRTVAIEGIDAGPVPTAVAAAVEAAGGTIVAASTAGGAVLRSEGLPAADLAGRPLVELGEVDKAHKLWGAAADVIVCGSKPGALTHQGTPFVRAGAVVPWGPIPLMTKALVELERAGVTVLPDFVAAAGGLLAGYTDGDEAAVTTAVAERIAALVRELDGHAEGAFLGACLRAEEFLRTWQDELPFGRPLAA